jgi:RND family efflux transporter MFP subunit
MGMRRKNGRDALRFGAGLVGVTLFALLLGSGSTVAETKPSSSSNAKLGSRLGEVTGLIKESRRYDLNAEVLAKVKRIHFKLGQRVKKGDLLVEFSAEIQKFKVQSARAAVLRAEAQLRQAEDDLSLYSRLKRTDAVSRVKLRNAQIQVDIAKANLLDAKASLGLAKADLSFMTVRAPIDGWISKVTLHEGQLVEAKAGKGRIAIIQQIDPAIVRFAISYDAVAKRVRAGLSQKDILGRLVFRLKLPDGTVYDHLGKSINDTFDFDAKARVFFAFARFPNPKGLLVPGLEVTVEVWSGPN